MTLTLHCVWPDHKGTITDYGEGCRRLIKETLAAKADASAVICEPFTTRDANFKGKTDGRTVPESAMVAKKIAGDLRLTFVPFQAELDKACKATPATFWLSESIHPTPAGHALMNQVWRRTVGI